MDHDLRIFRELVLWLWHTHERPWEYSHGTAKLIAEDIHFQDTFNNYEELERCLPTEDNVCSEFGRRFLYLNPITESRLMVPRIQLKCNFGRNIPEVRCRLELFLLGDDANIKSLGYRLESPEGQNTQGQGVHHYYHFQMIQPPTCTIDWLPETQPAFPLDADHPVKLLLCLLVSLYGLDYLGTILRNAPNILDLNEHVNHFPHTTFGTFEWYKLVEIGQPVRHTEGYKISANLNDFDTFINARYRGCNIRPITKSKFDALDNRQKHNYP